MTHLILTIKVWSNKKEHYNYKFDVLFKLGILFYEIINLFKHLSHFFENQSNLINLKRLSSDMIRRIKMIYLSDNHIKSLFLTNIQLSTRPANVVSNDQAATFFDL